ncbi:hypothetical protein HDU67_001557, partial [Dinochytrium kinnereticum]
ARPVVVVTPSRHVGGLEEMSDEEVFGLWRTVGDVVGLWTPSESTPTFKRIVLNAGTFRNIEHAHVKIYLETTDFTDRMSRWHPHMQQLWQSLYDLRREIKRPNTLHVLSKFSPSSLTHRITIEGMFEEDDVHEISQKVKGASGSISVERVGLINKGRHGCEVFVCGHAEKAAEVVLSLNLTRIGRLNLVCKVLVISGVDRIVGAYRMKNVSSEPT